MLQEDGQSHHQEDIHHHHLTADNTVAREESSSHGPPSRIAMALKVAAPLATRPSPPRAVSNNLKNKRVAPPKMTEDEAALEEQEARSRALSSSANTTPLVNASPSMEKDRFAALLAFGVAHQQQQQQMQLKQLPTSNARPNAAAASSYTATLHPAGSSSSLTTTTDEKAIALHPSASSSPTIHHQSSDNGSTIQEQALGTSTTQVHGSNQPTLVANSVLEYIRPARTNSTLSLLDNSTLTDNTSTILQQHRLHGISGQLQSTPPSIATTTASSSGSGALPSINFISSSTPLDSGSSTTSSTASNRMAALAARWGSSASAKLHSMSSNLNNNGTSSPSKGSTSSSYTGNSGHPSILDHSSRNTGGAMSGISNYPSPSSVSNSSNYLFQSDSAAPSSSSTDQGNENGNIPISSGTSVTSSSTTATNKQGSLQGHSKEAISKAVNIANRFKAAASNKMRGGGGNDNRSIHGIEESSSSTSTNMNQSRDFLPQHSTQPQAQMSKSSSLRSLSSFSSAIRTSSSNNLRKFSPSFSNSSNTTTSSDSNTSLSNSPSSITLASSANASGNGQQDGQMDSIPERSTGRRLGLHRATPSSLSNTLGLTHRQSPLSNTSISSSSSSPTSRHASALQTNSKESLINRSINSNGRFKNILGVNVPLGRAGEVFGAPLNVAADRTRLLVNVKDNVPALYGHAEMQKEEIIRRKEACFFLPAIAIRCLDYLNEYGKTEEGLYRIPGSTLQITNLRIIFDSGKDLDLLLKLDTRILEPSAVASCFKLWLRELPESLLHNMEREIDILLLEHTGNAASSKVTMAQAQSPNPPNSSNSNTSNSTGIFTNQQNTVPATTSASPLVIKRIKDLFANNLPKENVILLREISYHLAHLASFSNVTKMTFSNLRLILSPTLRLSPVMLSLLVNEREQVFPKPGTFLAAYQSENFENIHFNDSKLDLSLPLGNTNTASRVPAVQPKLTLSLPGEDGLPPVPPSKSPIARCGKGGVSSSSPPTIDLRTPFSSADSNWTSFSSPGQSSSSGQAGSHHRNSNSSVTGYRASWHMVDLPAPANRKDSSESADSETVAAATPIAKKFLNQRLSLSNLLDNHKEKGASPSSPAASEAGSRRSVSSNGSNMLTRTPTLTGRSPSPFFSSGASPAALGFMATHSRKRSSASSFSSIVSNSMGAGSAAGPAAAIWRSRKVSPQHDQSPKILQQSPKINDQEDDKTAQDEEEELSNSDTNTSICSSASSAKTPSDQHDLPDSIARRDGVVRIAGPSIEDDEEAGDSLSNITVDSRRATITAESFGQSFARTGKGKNANNEEMRRKRGSVMIMNMPNFQ